VRTGRRRSGMSDTGAPRRGRHHQPRRTRGTALAAARRTRNPGADRLRRAEGGGILGTRANGTEHQHGRQGHPDRRLRATSRPRAQRRARPHPEQLRWAPARARTRSAG
jgi:hypothetical protein